MTSLTDIADLYEDVEIRGKTLQVRGLGADTIAILIMKFPELRAMLSGTEDMRKEAGSSLMNKFPEAIPYVIAGATGDINNPAALRIAAKLNIEEQLRIITVAWPLTFPNGIGSFIAALTQAASLVDMGGGSDNLPDASGKEPGTTSPVPSKS